MVDPRFLESSVPQEKCEPLLRWAEQLVVTPSPPRLHEHFALQVTPELGMHTVARKRFQTGEIVVCEKALLRVPDLPWQKRNQVERRYGSRAAFFFPAISVDWGNVPKDVRSALALLFWAHPLVVGEGSSMVQANMDTCNDMFNWHPHLTEYWNSPAELMRFLHVVDLNIHRDDEVQAHAGFAGLFVLGSKFTHSCAPNCGWGFSSDGCLQYRAIRTIEPGDIFTFSYIGNGMNLVVSTLERRRRLASLWFFCRCDRCAGNDLSRQMRCPMCNAARCVPTYMAPEGSGWDGSRPLNDLVPEASRWRCLTCAATPTSSLMPLKIEEELVTMVPQVMQRDPAGAVNDAAAVDRLRRQASEALGKGHWTWVLATFAWLQKSFLIVCNSTIVPFNEKELQEGSAAVAKWFAEFATDSIEQRLSALFLATRLAHNLGGGLPLWGYDPADTLGRTGQSVANRLEEHGWRLRGPNSDEPSWSPGDRHGGRRETEWSAVPLRGSSRRRPGGWAPRNVDRRLYRTSGWR